MSLTILAARDEMLALFQTAWLADANSLAVPIIWEDVTDDPPFTDTAKNPDPWVKITVNHSAGGQATLANDAGKSRFRRQGVIVVGVYTPFGTGRTKADTLAEIAMKAFEGKKTAGGVWFRAVRMNEGTRTGAWTVTQVFAEFQYEEVHS